MPTSTHPPSVQSALLERAVAQRPDRLAWIRSPRQRGDILTAILFLAPSLIVFAVFTYYALGFNFYLSAVSWNFISPTKEFVGLANYDQLINDARFWTVVRNTFYYAGASVTLGMLLGLGLALLLNQAVPARGIFRTLIFTPYVTTIAAIALLWVWILDPRYGLINYGLGLLGFDGPRWLSDPQWAMPALIIMNVWRTMGYDMVIFLAGLSAIPRELYEAADIDGAGRISKFFHITLPLLSPTTFFIMVTSLIGALQVFDQVAVMTAGGPVDATKVFNYYLYEQAFAFFRAGYAAAVAVVLFLIILALTILQFVISRRWVHYD